MSLVAYGSSDESDDECPNSTTPDIVSSKTDIAFTNKKVETALIGPSSADTTIAKDVDRGESKNEKNDMFSSIPAPKLKVISRGNEKMDNLPVKKSTVKISVPSLSEFKDDDTEPTKKKLKPSSKGSGLFALLPAPRNVFLKETKSSDGTKTQAPLVPRALSKPIKTPPVIPKRFLKPTEDEIIPEEDQNSLDFFSLGSLNDVPEEDSIPDMSGSANSKLNLPPPRSWALPEAVTEQSTVSKEEPSSSNSEETENFFGVDNGNIQLSEEALHKLCGRRAIRQQQEVEVIDVSGAELIPDPTEWLTKQLTEERQLPSRGFGRRHDGPTSQQRRKHQITYLAFQAKENELELKNQWSQNRMSRKQTQSKYGF